MYPAETAIGRIVGWHGIRGEVKVQVYADLGDRFENLRQAMARLPDASRRALSVKSIRSHKTYLLISWEGVETVNEAEALRGAELLVPSATREELPEDQYFLNDLIGAEVVTTSGEVIGPITEVLRSPAHDIYVTERGMIPAVKRFILEVDVPNRRITVDPLEGMFSEPPTPEPSL